MWESTDPISPTRHTRGCSYAPLMYSYVIETAISERTPLPFSLMPTAVDPSLDQSATLSDASGVPEQSASTEVAITRSEEYCFDTVTIQVDRTLFKVPQYRFVEDSSIFRDIYSMSQDGNQDVEGSSDQRPIIIEAVDKVDFVNFLRELYPRSHPSAPRDKLSRSLAQWIGILKLSTM